MFAELSTRLAAGENLTTAEAFDLCNTLVRGDVTNEQAAHLLVLLAAKGESAEELHGFVSCLLSHSVKVPYQAATLDTWHGRKRLGSVQRVNGRRLHACRNWCRRCQTR